MRARHSPAAAELAEKISNQRDTLGERWGRPLDAHAVLPGEPYAAVALHEQDKSAGVERRLLHELQCRTLWSGVDLANAHRFCHEPQTMAGEKCLRRLGRAPEAVDELFLPSFELLEA